MSEKTRKIAVLTGDLVNSTALGAEKTERAMQALLACAETQEVWMGAPLHFTRSRGDGWQVVLARPEMALRSALAFRATLRIMGRSIDTHIGFAVGAHGEEQLDLNSATSEVFILSGRALDMVKAGRGACFEPHDTIRNAGAYILADEVSRNWSPAQAAAILPKLAPGRTERNVAIARRLGKSHQAVYKAQEAGWLAPLLIALERVEEDRYV
jgi:hypothetical protein